MLAGEILKEVREFVEQGISAQTIIKGLRRASALAVNRIKEISIDMKESSEDPEKKIETLRRLAGTAMNSKLIKRNSDFFTKSESRSVACLCSFFPTHAVANCPSPANTCIVQWSSTLFYPSTRMT